MRNRLTLMVSLLAIAGIMAAMAYTSASVTNEAEASVVSTDEALLALSCNDGIGFNDNTCEVGGDGRLHLNFSAGLGGNDYGLQPGSVYEWGDPFGNPPSQQGLVRITNNSEDFIAVGVDVVGPLADFLTVVVTGAGHPGDLFPDGFTFGLTPGGSGSIHFAIEVPEDGLGLGDLEGEVIIHSQAVSGW